MTVVHLFWYLWHRSLETQRPWRPHRRLGMVHRRPRRREQVRNSLEHLPALWWPTGLALQLQARKFLSPARWCCVAVLLLKTYLLVHAQSGTWRKAAGAIIGRSRRSNEQGRRRVGLGVLRAAAFGLCLRWTRRWSHARDYHGARIHALGDR